MDGQTNISSSGSRMEGEVGMTGDDGCCELREGAPKGGGELTRTRIEDGSDSCEGIMLGDGLEDEPFENMELAAEVRLVITGFFNFE